MGIQQLKQTRQCKSPFATRQENRAADRLRPVCCFHWIELCNTKESLFVDRMATAWTSLRMALNFRSMDRSCTGKLFEAKRSIRFLHRVFERANRIRSWPLKSPLSVKMVQPMASGWVLLHHIFSMCPRFKTIRSEWEICWPTPMKWNWRTVDFVGQTRSRKMHKAISTSQHHTFQIQRYSRPEHLLNYEQNYGDFDPANTKRPLWYLWIWPAALSDIVFPFE